jgi:hypothetical protein
MSNQVVRGFGRKWLSQLLLQTLNQITKTQSRQSLCRDLNSWLPEWQSRELLFNYSTVTFIRTVFLFVTDVSNFKLLLLFTFQDSGLKYRTNSQNRPNDSFINVIEVPGRGISISLHVRKQCIKSMTIINFQFFQLTLYFESVCTQSTKVCSVTRPANYPLTWNERHLLSLMMNSWCVQVQCRSWDVNRGQNSVRAYGLVMIKTRRECVLLKVIRLRIWNH